MANSPSVFAFDSAALRVLLDEAGAPWFNAGDLCAVLGFGNPRQAVESHVDSEDVQKLDALTGGGTQAVNHVNESGMYTLIFGSTKPEAKKFKRWVTSEVLPSIRKTGAYQAPKARGNGPLPTMQLIGLQRHSWELIDRLKREGNAELRRTYHRQLEAVFGDLGTPAPTLSCIGADDSDQPNEVTSFWAVYNLLQAAGVQVNHHRDASLIAINLKQFAQAASEHGQCVPASTRLKDALRRSTQPRFLDVKSVSSAVLGHTVHCWIFAAPVATSPALEGGAA